MRKTLCLAAVAILLSALIKVHAQTAATEGVVKYAKGSKVAAVIELPHAPGTVEQAIKEYIAARGVKGNKSKGFSIFRSVKLKEGDAELNDLHFKVERKSRKEKNVSRVYLLAGRPGENIRLRTAGDRYKVEEAKGFLEQIAPSITSYNLEQEITRQQEMVSKAEKRLKTLQNDQKALEEKLKTNRNEQQQQLDEIAKQKAILETIAAKRKAS